MKLFPCIFHIPHSHFVVQMRQSNNAHNRVSRQMMLCSWVIISALIAYYAHNETNWTLYNIYIQRRTETGRKNSRQIRGVYLICATAYDQRFGAAAQKSQRLFLLFMSNEACKCGKRPFDPAPTTCCVPSGKQDAH